eukprot:XP_013984997.1 PREDICTED: uncharacterized protein LOC106563708 [Salmo salar]
MSVYIFWCPPEFKNCDVEMVKQCDIYNGGCFHFCVLKAQHAVCDCAAGYELALDKSTCEPEGLFPCGRLSHVICSILSSRTIITAVNVDQTQHSYNDALNITVVSLAVNATATPPPQQHQQHQQHHHQQHQQHHHQQHQPLFLSARGPALLGLLPNNAHHPGRVVQRTAHRWGEYSEPWGDPLAGVSDEQADRAELLTDPSSWDTWFLTGIVSWGEEWKYGIGVWRRRMARTTAAKKTAATAAAKKAATK